MLIGNVRYKTSFLCFLRYFAPILHLSWPETIAISCTFIKVKVPNKNLKLFIFTSIQLFLHFTIASYSIPKNYVRVLHLPSLKQQSCIYFGILLHEDKGLGKNLRFFNIVLFSFTKHVSS